MNLILLTTIGLYWILDFSSGTVAFGICATVLLSATVKYIVLKLKICGPKMS